MRTSESGFEKGTLNAYVVTPEELKDADRFGYKIVAVLHEGWSGWAAYRGPTSWTNERVAANGDAITEEAAKLLFPTLTHSGRIYLA